jgi:hypothetical protein
MTNKSDSPDTATSNLAGGPEFNRPDRRVPSNLHEFGAFSTMAGTARPRRPAGQRKAMSAALRSQYFILGCGVRGPERDSRNENVSHVRCCGGGGLRRTDDRPLPVCRHGGFIDYRDRGTPSPPERIQRLLGAASIALCEAAGTVVVRLGRNASARASCRFTPKPDPGGHFPVMLSA